MRATIRLPTFWCSPNFAYLMMSDAHEALRALPGAPAVSVRLVDHFEGERITEAVAAPGAPSRRPSRARPRAARRASRRFRLKAFVVRQEPVLRAAREAIGDAAAVALRMGDGSRPQWAEPDDWAEYLVRRRELGMGEDPGASSSPTPKGGRSRRTGCRTCRLARSVRISLESNTEFCTGLLAAHGDGLEEWRAKEVAA